MAVRTTDAEVEAIVEVEDDIALIPFIAAANQLVTELCVDSDYSDARLTMIETWMSAHFYKIRDQAVADEKAGDVGVSYQYKIDLVLFETTYGQMAMALDTAGNLAQLSKRIEEGESASVSIGWLGKDYDTTDPDD